ncbi:hypothetical protein BLA60_24535 [Actinophytocola xinjiangensis]|uniref:Uncharacterized protein n=1 Tax=Actinophytocola xinjiangensis TaxID=485602 RepID=A0A7Z1AWI4_9PSEU|nr:hypothetical protein BLA60_24535 [Actinophytocola xinjiangensis]
MTVHARQVARHCREQMAARDEDQRDEHCDQHRDQHRDQHQANQPDTPPLEETRPMSREEALRA